MITPAMLERLEELEKKATDGPWHTDGKGDILVTHEMAMRWECADISFQERHCDKASFWYNYNGVSLLSGWDDGTGWFDNKHNAELLVFIRNILPDLLAATKELTEVKQRLEMKLDVSTEDAIDEYLEFTERCQQSSHDMLTKALDERDALAKELAELKARKVTLPQALPMEDWEDQRSTPPLANPAE